jgi:hypothetical protein
MENYSVGTIITSKICPGLVGKIKELCNNQTAIIEVKDRNLNIRDMVVSLEYWKVCILK